MNRFLALLLVVMMVVGCRSRATPLSNPFLAPDRVPPPATRMPAPGTAVPYFDNGQSVGPPVIQGAGGQGIGAGTYAPGASAVPKNGPNSALASNGVPGVRLTGDVLPPPPRPVRTAIAEVPIERGISIPTDDRSARLAVRPVAASTLVRPEPAPTLRPEVRTVATAPIGPPFQTVSTADPSRAGSYSNQWLSPGQYGTPTSGRGASPQIASPPTAAVVPASVTIPVPQSFNSSAGIYPIQAGSVVAAPMVASGGCCPPFSQGFFPNGWQTVEISELPPAGAQRGQSSRSAASRDRSPAARGSGARAGRWSRPSFAGRSGPSAVRLASAERSTGSDQLLTTAADATPRTWARYGLGPRYEWLQGRLERSSATGQWKLRYIPIDGATDDYGGSVVIDNLRVLGDFDPGDFVKAYGSLDSRRSDDVSFAAIYRVTRVQLLAE